MTKYDFVIVGSGAGGATLAKELATKGRNVLIVEKGTFEKKVGTLGDILRFFDVDRSTKSLRYSKEGVMLLRTFMAGGTTVVSCGNGVRTLEKELGNLGINLEEEWAEAEEEMHLAPISKQLLSEGSESIINASEELGYSMDLMPKFIASGVCVKCGHCCAGCQSGAKWSALDYLERARQSGANFLYDTTVDRVLVENGKAKGIAATGPQGYREIQGDTIVLCAGALATPVILQRSGIKEAGSGLFADMCINAYGVTNGLNQMSEPTMALICRDFYKDKGFILSPFINQMKLCRFAELGAKGLTLPVERLIGFMIKIRDEAVGSVHPDGTVSKGLTAKDRSRFHEGSLVAKEILIKAGADEKSVIFSKPQAPHPGGTAAIGSVVDNHLQTEVDNLFVCDASVLPTAPGLPLILTIVGLAKRLAKTLAP